MYGTLNTVVSPFFILWDGCCNCIAWKWFSFHKLNSQMINMTDTQSITVEKELGLNKRLADISAATSVISTFPVVIAFYFHLKGVQ